MATPTLALIPTGYKAGKLYSVLPESGVGDFTVVRATEATRVNEEGLIETMGANVPRLDYSGGGCPVLLTEPQSTNYDFESTNFSTSFMSNSSGISSSVLTSNIAPDGSSNSVYKITKVTDNSDPYLGRSGVVFTSTSMVFSAWLWTDEDQPKDVLLIVYRDGAQEVQTKNITLTTTPTRYFIEASFTTTPSSISYRIDLNELESNQYIYAWGKQLEAGSYATSYIPTSGSAVTRNGDQVNGAGDAATFNDSEGVLMAEVSALANDGTDRYITLGTTVNNVYIRYQTSTNSIRCNVTVNGSSQFIASTTLNDATVNTKLSIKYKLNDFSLWINGFLIKTDLSGLTPIGLSELAFDDGGGGNDFYGKTKQIQYFNTVLTDSELETLTSWTSFIEMAQAQNYNII